MGRLKQNASLEIKDENFINKVLLEIMNSKGTMIKNNDEHKIKDILYDFQFHYNNKDINEKQIEEQIKEGYITNLFISKDGVVYIPKYTKNSKTNLLFLKTSLSKKTMDYIKKYYESRI